MITKDQAINARMFYHVELKNKDGTPLRARAAMAKRKHGKRGLMIFACQSSMGCMIMDISHSLTHSNSQPRNETMNTESIRTIKDAKRFASSIGMSINKTEYGEYRVTASRKLVPDYDRREALAYYSDDLQDALHTMQAIQMELNSKAPMVTEY